MERSFRESIVDRYVAWSEGWGLTLAFAVTCSVERSEALLSEALVGLVTTELRAGVRSLAPSFHATRFASALWEQAREEAFRTFSQDPFFRLPPITRAATVLRAQAKFTNVQIAEVLKITNGEVEEHLENARLLFSAGRPWIESSPHQEDPQPMFARYVANDLDLAARGTLQSHIYLCEPCRKNFAFFKEQHAKWEESLPRVSIGGAMLRHLRKNGLQALRFDRRRPSPWPGLRRIFRDGQVRTVLLGLGLLAVTLHLLLR